MIQKMMKRIKTMIASRYAHLCIGLLVLYGVSLAVTHTSHFEKVMNALRWYCYADYESRISRNSKERGEAVFYREKYKERLISLAEGYFDYQDKKETQNFFLSKGFLYDVWSGKNGHSYLFAQVIERGYQKVEVPEGVAFEYFILGDKKIVPFPEYRRRHWATDFVSAGEKGIYVHRDSLEPLLHWYFESLWIVQPRGTVDFHSDPLTYSLYRDLRGTCKDLFIKNPLRTKQTAQGYFIKEGFNVFLPTFLAMGAKMAADRDSDFPPDYQYLRACLTGLSLNPNHTMFYLLKTSRPNGNHPQVRKAWRDFHQRLNLTYPDQITLEQISENAQEILNGLENSPTPRE